MQTTACGRTGDSFMIVVSRATLYRNKDELHATLVRIQKVVLLLLLLLVLLLLRFDISASVRKHL